MYISIIMIGSGDALRKTNQKDNIGVVYVCKTNKNRHFTKSLAQNEHEYVNLRLNDPNDPTSRIRINTSVIGAAEIRSKQNIHYQMMLWTSDKFNNGHNYIDFDTPSYGFRLLRKPPLYEEEEKWYRLLVQGIGTLYYDEDETQEFHISLVNRSPSAKLAGEDGYVVIYITYGFANKVGKMGDILSSGKRL